MWEWVGRIFRKRKVEAGWSKRILGTDMPYAFLCEWVLKIKKRQCKID